MWSIQAGPDLHKSSGARSGLQSWRKECYVDRRNSLRGALEALLRGASQRRHYCGLSLTDMFGMFEEQRGRCSYSGIPLSLAINTSFGMSLERIDNSKGYTHNNCAFIATEFNSTDRSKSSKDKLLVTGSAKWSRAKFDAIPCLRASAVDLKALLKQAHEVLHPEFVRKNGMPPLRPSTEKEAWCSRRASFRPLACFSVCRLRTRGVQCRCKECSSDSFSSYQATLRGAVVCKLRHCNRRATLTMSDVLDMILEQGGRGFYSGVPLQLLKPHTDWQWSMERLGTSLGYTRENSVLVAGELNTWSRNKAAQWSRAKADRLWGPFVNPDLRC